MNTLKGGEIRRKAAIATAALIGMVGLSGCGFSLSNPDMKPQDKAKFEKILKPAAVKAAQKVVAFVKKDEKDQTYLSYVSPDSDVPDGYQVTIDSPSSSGGPYIDARMKGRRQNGKLVLSPRAVYYLDTSYPGGDELISYTERDYSVYRRQVWYAQGFSELGPNGKDSVIATTHVDEPRNAQNISDSLDYAKSVAQDFPGLVADELQSIQTGVN